MAAKSVVVIARAGYLPALVALLAGSAARECQLVAVAAPLALLAFYARMTALPPADPFRLAVRVALAGVGSLLSAGLLAALAMAMVGGFWPGEATHPPYVSGFVFATLALLAAFVLDERVEEHQDYLLAWGTVAFASGLVAANVLVATRMPACLVTLGVAFFMAHFGWRLLGFAGQAVAGGGEGP